MTTSVIRCKSLPLKKVMLFQISWKKPALSPLPKVSSSSMTCGAGGGGSGSSFLVSSEGVTSASAGFSPGFCSVGSTGAASSVCASNSLSFAVRTNCDRGISWPLFNFTPLASTSLIVRGPFLPFLILAPALS